MTLTRTDTLVRVFVVPKTGACCVKPGISVSPRARRDSLLGDWVSLSFPQSHAQRSLTTCAARATPIPH